MFNPGLLLAMWAAGIAGASAWVAHRRIVGPGYLWLAVGAMSLAGIGALVFDSGSLVVGACLIGLGSAAVARRSPVATITLALSAVLFLAAAVVAGLAVPALTGSVALGAVTAEMLLGHWYLVSPRIPRRPLRRLAVAGAVGIVLDTVVVLLLPGLPIAGSNIGLAISLGLAGASVLLMAAVWFALGYPSYPGVMAATGLSYLAVLTTLGSVSMVRTLADAGVS